MTDTKPFWQKPIFVLIFATAVIVVAYGSRQSFGVFLRPITTEFGWGREGLSLAIATQALVYGIAAPFIGVLADKWGPIRVLILAGTLYLLGFLATSQATTRPLSPARPPPQRRIDPVGLKRSECAWPSGNGRTARTLSCLSP